MSQSKRKKNIYFGTPPDVNAAMAQTAIDNQRMEETLEDIAEAKANAKRKRVNPKEFKLADSPSYCSESEVVCPGQMPYEDSKVLISKDNVQIRVGRKLFNSDKQRSNTQQLTATPKFARKNHTGGCASHTEKENVFHNFNVVQPPPPPQKIQQLAGKVPTLWQQSSPSDGAPSPPRPLPIQNLVKCVFCKKAPCDHRKDIDRARESMQKYYDTNVVWNGPDDFHGNKERRQLFRTFYRHHIRLSGRPFFAERIPMCVRGVIQWIYPSRGEYYAESSSDDSSCTPVDDPPMDDTGEYPPPFDIVGRNI